jgi:hypothetical protein
LGFEIADLSVGKRNHGAKIRGFARKATRN